MQRTNTQIITSWFEEKTTEFIYIVHAILQFSQLPDCEIKDPEIKMTPFHKI